MSSTAALALPDRLQQAEHLNNYAWALMFSGGGRARETTEAAMEAYRLAEAVGDLEDQGLALQYAALAWRLMGRFDDALRTFRQALALSDRAGTHSHYVGQLQGYAFTLETAGRHAQAIEHYQRALREAERRPMPPSSIRTARASAFTGMSTAYCALGQWAECLRTGALALPIATELDSLRLLGRVHIAMGRAHAALGHTVQARADLVRGIELFEGNFVAGDALDMSFLARARETLAELGHDGSA